MSDMRVLLACVALAGCASAGKGNSIIGGLDDAGVGDANDFPSIDAAVIDAPPEQVTLSQSAADTITAGNTFACRDVDTGVTAENHYYRMFALDDHGVRGTLHVQHVDFGIEKADGGFFSSQSGKVSLGVYGGAITDTVIDLAKVRSVASADIKIADGRGTRMTVPITGDVAAGSILVVELGVDDGALNDAVFLIGSNNQGERRPGFTRAVDCGYTSPTKMATIAKDIGVAEADIILSVTGTR